ncbi:hypothetical protein K450DRAFT_278371 [Umbelopsis ramanniana AG]|uniref:Uncharacterized protein n=1 Tax=Umbelopsis ramanniana AG TaxID=1314678 RepID=A0AAD5HHL2_UMBRA|nr:uncharacterized protein K450DRAFT_278371 [Umbelopsis ramanniana AG]KAI8582318.1 hypothetical protein K450DRAFT_278371 [Umbelopsis ramanniana AG]
MQAIALLVTLLLPIVLIYLIRHENGGSSSASAAKKKKKSKKKSSKAADSTQASTPALIDVKDAADREVKKPSKQMKQEKQKDKVKEKDTVQIIDEPKEEVTITTEKANTPTEQEKAAALSFVEERMKKAAKDSEVSGMAIDQHMDNTSRFSRVMRIKTDEPPAEEEWEPVEPGWNRKASKARSTPQIASANSFEPLTKKQRENLAKARKKKEAKATQEAEQEARLRQHKRELEKLRINDFYSKGPGKKIISQSNVWGSGSPGSGKRPQGVASLNEHGQLIWD